MLLLLPQAKIRVGVATSRIVKRANSIVCLILFEFQPIVAIMIGVMKCVIVLFLFFKLHFYGFALRYCIDLLLGSFAGAHVSIDPTVKQEAKTTLNVLLQSWTSMLQIVTEDDKFGTRTENN